eukprot:339636-Hanusia_phi.AAC.1
MDSRLTALEANSRETTKRLGRMERLMQKMERLMQQGFEKMFMLVRRRAAGKYTNNRTQVDEGDDDEYVGDAEDMVDESLEKAGRRRQVREQQEPEPPNAMLSDTEQELQHRCQETPHPTILELEGPQDPPGPEPEQDMAVWSADDGAAATRGLGDMGAERMQRLVRVAQKVYAQGLTGQDAGQDA